MNHWRAFRWMLAITVIASLVVAPLSRPAMAGMPAAGSKAAASDASAGHAMAGHAMPGHALAGHDMSLHHQMMPMAVSADQLAMLDVADPSSVVSAVVSAHEMPCCPAKAPMTPDCDQCLYMALCLAKFLTGLPSAIAQPMAMTARRVVTLRNDSWPARLGHPPPEHPPRHLV